MIQAPVPAKATDKTALEPCHLPASAALPAIEGAETSLVRRVLDCQRPPPLDAVIVYAHLTI
jgi:hypothetical protein